MHRNPFVPPPSYPQPQPPLPPGPPPHQIPQADYSAYWAAAAAAQNQTQQAPAAPYANQWTAPQPAQPPRPPPEQSALYANYGYGGNQSHWQQQQQRQQNYQPPAPVAQPPPPPPYNPYQPQAPYQQQQQHYIPQPVQPPLPPQQVYHHHPPQPLQPQPTQQYFPQQPRQHQNRQQTNSQHFPPAKRQRFDQPRNQQQSFQQQPQFQPAPIPMPPPMQQQQQTPVGNYGPVQPQNQQPNGRNVPGVNQVPLGGRGGGGGRGAGRGKSGSMNARGGSAGRGGRGGMYGSNNRGNATQGGGSFRNHGRGFGNRDRRGGSFNAGAYSHQQGSSFRGRYNRPGRHDSGNFNTRDSAASSSKKEEPKRTVTDFKLIGLEIPELCWSWGFTPQLSDKLESKNGLLVTQLIKAETEDSVPSVEDNTPPVSEAEATMKPEPVDTPLQTADVARSALDVNAVIDKVLSPPSRLRIYFHTAVTADDAAPIPHASALPVDTSSASLLSSRKGKRKRTDDEDEDGDFDSAPIHPETSADGDAMSIIGTADMDDHNRDSVAPSVTETVSEGDWLMAAIGEDEGDGDASNADEADHHDAPFEEEHPDGNDVDNAESSVAAPLRVFASEVSPLQAEQLGNEGSDAVVNEPECSSVTFSASSLPDGEAAVSQEAHDIGDQVQPDSSTEQNIHPHEPVSMLTVNTQDADFGPHAVNDEQSADQPSSSDKQVSNDGPRTAPLQADASFASTIPDSETQDVSFSDFSLTLVNENTLVFNESATQSVTNAEDIQETVLANTESVSSANRLAITYAAASRRIVINAEVVHSLKVFRNDHRIEISVLIERDDENQLKGIMVEALSETTKTYTPLELSSDAYESDPMLPPFLKASAPCRILLLAHMDVENPTMEARWVKSGDLQEWLKAMFGRMFWVAETSNGWEKKIEVVDPDPAPTIQTVLDGWATNGNVGVQTERQRFVRTHLTETDNVLEILLRLVRGERATPFSQSTATVAATQNSVPGPLLSAIEGAAHGAQQTHVSLAVLALFRIGVEYAKKADGEKGKTEVEERMGEIVRCLPSHLLHKSLDGMFKEWKTEKKSGR